MPKITKKFIENCQAQDCDQFFWDDELKGFGLRIKSSGRRTFIVQYRNSAGRSRRLTIGQFGRLTVTEARSLARQHLAEVDKGNDPAETKLEERSAPSLAQMAERYLSEHAIPKKKPRSVQEDQRILRDIILPALGHVQVRALTRQDVAQLHHKLRTTPTQANRVIALLSKMLNLAEKWNLRPYGTNPCLHIDKFKENKRKRYLSTEEMKRLGNELNALEKDHQELPSIALAIKLLLLTGCRLSEILELRWEHVDFKRGVLELPDSKTGSATIPLGRAALATLAEAPRIEGNPFVCPGRKEGTHLVGLPRAWQRIRKRAGIEDVRIHDLRHSFASVGAGSGLGLPVIGGLLGHKDSATTARYAHLATDPLRRAADGISGSIATALFGANDSKE